MSHVNSTDQAVNLIPVKQKLNSVVPFSPNTQLYIVNNQEYLPLPEWGIFFIRLGYFIVESEIVGNRLIIALAIPTRAYAAALTAFGVALARSELSHTQIENDDYFDQLCNLQKGTPITFLDKGKKKRAIYEGYEKVCGQRRLRIRLESRESGGLTELIPLEKAHNILIKNTPINKLPKKQKGRKIISYSSFFEEIIGKERAINYSINSQLECIIIGRRNLLQSEIKGIPFSCHKKSQSGFLQDILRVKSFFSTDDQAYRSEVFSVSSRKPPRFSDGKIPFVTIFDGASGFIKWRANWRNSQWIILLDRTENDFQEAVDIINQDYIQKRVEESGSKNLSFIPSGIEAVIYQEAR
jgi:hypothetical protein